MDWPSRLSSLAARPRTEPFAPHAIEAVANVSRRITGSTVAREFPELAALAHWFRPASLKIMRDQLFASSGDHVLRPRGSVFVIAPANVDVLFIYGWLLSLLTGNSTVVRVSQKPSKARDAFLSVVKDAVEDGATELVQASEIISYPHESEMTGRLSAWCDLRLVWGGDQTVASIRAVPLKPTALEAGFADRFSLAAFDADAILALDDRAVEETARKFVNDVMWFGQQACSSPRVIFWIGNPNRVEQAKARFWPLFAKAVKGFEDEPAAMMARVTDLYEMAANGVIDSIAGPVAGLPGRGATRTPHAKVRDLHSGHGLLVEYRVNTLADLAPFLIDKDQTLVLQGFSAREVNNLAERLPNRAIDRMVRVGRATDFEVSWDGINLLDLMSRRVSVPRTML